MNQKRRISTFEAFNESLSFGKYDKRALKMVLTKASNNANDDVAKWLKKHKEAILSGNSEDFDYIIFGLKDFCDQGIVVEQMSHDAGFNDFGYTFWDRYEKVKEFAEAGDLKSAYYEWFLEEKLTLNKNRNKDKENSIAMDILKKISADEKAEKEGNPTKRDLRSKFSLPYFMVKELRKKYPTHTFDENTPTTVEIHTKNGNLYFGELLGDNFITVNDTTSNEVKNTDVKEVVIK